MFLRQGVYLWGIRRKLSCRKDALQCITGKTVARTVGICCPNMRKLDE